MRGRGWMGVVLAAGLAAGAAAAEGVPEDAMAVQRCVWACLAESSGPESPEYGACVDQRCTVLGLEAAPPAPAAPAPPAEWPVVLSEDGQWRMTGLADRPRGAALWVMCAVSGPARHLVLQGPEGPDVVLRLLAGGQTFDLPFVRQGDAYYAALPGDDSVLAALRRAPDLALLNAQGGTLLAVTLTGARAALQAACPPG